MHSVLDVALADLYCNCRNSLLFSSYYTLAHIDLEKFNPVKDAFDEFARQLSADAVAKGLKHIVSGASKATAFGTNAEKEGHADIIDLADFADRCV